MCLATHTLTQQTNQIRSLAIELTTKNNTEKALRFMKDRMLTIAVSFDNGVVKIACNNKYYNDATLSSEINISNINFGDGVWGTTGYAKGNLMIRKIYTYSRSLSAKELMDASGLFL